MALVMAFIISGVLIQIINIELGGKVINVVVRVVFITIGIIGLIGEMSNKNINIDGIQELGMGIFFAFLSLFLTNKFNWIVCNWICLICLLIGLYGSFFGIIKIIKYIINNRNFEMNKIIESITKLLGVILVLVQIIKTVNEFL